MPKELFEFCLYTTIHPDKLEWAAYLRGPSTFEVRQRMVKVREYFRIAKAQDKVVAVLFSDSTNCIDLIYWARLIHISVQGNNTHFTVSHISKLEPERKIDALVKVSNGRKLSKKFIRPYAVVKKPSFLPNT